MSSKFSHRRTRVQHKPKTCISLPPPPPTPPALGHTLLFDADVYKLELFLETHLIFSGSCVQEPGTDHYRAMGLDVHGYDYDLYVDWPPAMGMGSLTIASVALARTWVASPLAGYSSVPWGPIIMAPHPTTGIGGGSITLNLHP